MLVELFKGIVLLLALGWIPPVLFYAGFSFMLKSVVDEDRGGILFGLGVVLMGAVSIWILFALIDSVLG